MLIDAAVDSRELHLCDVRGVGLAAQAANDACLVRKIFAV
jgi:hypothetical protein